MIAAVLPPPLEPPPSRSRASGSRRSTCRAAPGVRRRLVRRARPARRRRGRVPAVHADDHRAGDGRRTRDLRRAEEDRRGRDRRATATRSQARIDAHGLHARRGARARSATPVDIAPNATRSTSTSSAARRPTARASTPSPRSCTATGTRRRATAERSTATLDAARLAARPDRRHPGRPRSSSMQFARGDHDPDRRGRRAGAGRLAAARSCTSATTTCRCSGSEDMTMDATDRYTIISADAHAGLPCEEYRPVSRRAATTTRSTSSSPSARRTATSR